MRSEHLALPLSGCRLPTCSLVSRFFGGDGRGEERSVRRLEVCSGLDFAMRSLLFLCEFQFVLDCLLCFQLKVTNTALWVVGVGSAGSSQRREHFVRPTRTRSRSDPAPSWYEDKINSHNPTTASTPGREHPPVRLSRGAARGRCAPPASRFGSEPVRGHQIATTLSTDGATCYAE